MTTKINLLRKKVEVDTVSGELHEIVNKVVEDFKTLLNSNGRENSVTTAENARMLKSELASQVS